MMRGILFGTVALLATSALAAEAGQDDVKAAAKKLADADSYSWKQNTENAGGGGGGGRGGGPTEGKTEKDGYTYLKMTRGNNTVEVVMKGEKAAIKTEDGWKTPEEAAQDNGGGQPNPGRFLGRMVRNLKAPAAQAQDLADKVKELAKSDDAYSGDLSEEGAKQLLMFGGGRRGGGNANGNGNAPEISNAKGSVKFWTKDGTLTKYEYHVQGTVSFNGNDRDVDRTTTVEISDVGSTKVDVPDEAKKKLS